MLSVRVFLIIQILLLASLGLAYFVLPHELANFTGMLLMAPAAVTDVRAYHGGLRLCLAVWLLLALLRAELLRPALMLLVLLYSSLFLARLGGLWLDAGAQQTFNLYAMLFEGVSAALAFYLLHYSAAA